MFIVSGTASVKLQPRYYIGVIFIEANLDHSCAGTEMISVGGYDPALISIEDNKVMLPSILAIIEHVNYRIAWNDEYSYHLFLT